MRRWLLAFACACALLSPGAALRAQTVSLGILGGRQALGAEAQLSYRRVAAFLRTEGFLADVNATSLGARLWPFARGPYLTAGVARVMCDPTEFGGGATGCDGQSHDAATVGAGVELAATSASVAFFVDGGFFIPFERTSDVPTWTFAAGLRVPLIPK